MTPTVSPPLPGRAPTDSGTVSTHLVMPGDTNMHGTAFGGKIMEWMDIIASVAASRHCGQSSVTAAVDDLTFSRPIRMGDIVILKACVNFVGTTSMEVGVRVEREMPTTRAREHCLSGYFTFVAIGPDGKPQSVPPLKPRDAIDKKRFEAGRKRHDARRQSRPHKVLKKV